MRLTAFYLLSIVLLGLCVWDTAFAGIIELSATTNFRKTNYDATHSDAMQAGTGSIAYYFWDMSALEISYTRGAAEQIQPEYTAYQDLTAYGLDVLFTIANRESALKPYIKAGAAYTDKNLRYFVPTFNPITVDTKGIAPTAGMGFKLMITQQLAIKAGMDVSTSPLFMYSKTISPAPTTPPADDPVTYDFSANAGISFLF